MRSCTRSAQYRLPLSFSLFLSCARSVSVCASARLCVKICTAPEAGTTGSSTSRKRCTRSTICRRRCATPRRRSLRRSSGTSPSQRRCSHRLRLTHTSTRHSAKFSRAGALSASVPTPPSIYRRYPPSPFSLCARVCVRVCACVLHCLGRSRHGAQESQAQRQPADRAVDEEADGGRAPPAR
eukprot:COSAG03_NODE_337_length_8860_cov_33.996690_8_plen_182_part_00